nr:uncharacterized protein LOC109741944 [Aegilops tauschii subsp. strangulata]
MDANEMRRRRSLPPPSPPPEGASGQSPPVAGGGGALSSPRSRGTARAGCLSPDAALGAGRSSSTALRRGPATGRGGDATGSAEVVRAGGRWWRQLHPAARPDPPPEPRVAGDLGRGRPLLPWLVGGGAARQLVDVCAAARSGPCGWSASYDTGDPSGGHPWTWRRALCFLCYGHGPLPWSRAGPDLWQGCETGGFGAGSWLEGRELRCGAARRRPKWLPVVAVGHSSPSPLPHPHVFSVPALLEAEVVGRRSRRQFGCGFSQSLGLW